MNDRPTRRDLMKPIQLVGLAFAAALFGGIITLVSMGFFQADAGVGSDGRALVVAGIVAGISFIATLLGMALLLLAIDPAQMQKPVDRAVLLPDEPTDTPDAPEVPRS